MNYGIKPQSDNWPVSITAAGVDRVQALDSPGTSLSHFVTGYVAQAGAATTFNLPRRQCILFDHTDCTLTVADNASLQMGALDFVIEFWIKGNFNANAVLLDKDDGANDGYLLESTADGYMKLTVGDGADVGAVTGAVACNDGNWHHVCFVIDKSVALGIYLYVDGVLDTQMSTDDLTDVGNVNANAVNLVITGDDTKDMYFGPIGIWNAASIADTFTASYVEGRYASGVGLKYDGDETGLVWAVNNDEGTGTVANGLTATANNGTFAGNETWTDGDGHPFTRTETLAQVGPFDILAVTVGQCDVTFPHPIKIGRNNPLHVYFVGAGTITLFGFTEDAS